jgi:aminodeoxychorismate lyase
MINLNGKILNEAKAGISVNNRSFRYGDGLFETMKMMKGRIIHAEQHFNRLFAGMQTLQFQVPKIFTPDFLLKQINELAMQNGHAKLGRVRLTIFRGDGGLYDTVNHSPNYLLQTWELNAANNELNENGLVIDFYEGTRKYADALANVKSNNYLPYLLAAMHAKQNNLNDCLLLNHEGHVCDATIANVFVVKDGEIITSKLSDGCVAGVMRDALLHAFDKSGFKMNEKSLSKEDVLTADECFLTNSIYGVRWVKMLGDKTFGNTMVQKIHREIVKEMFA